MKRDAGFSFLEIIVVLLVFGLLATFAVPQFFSAFEKTNTTEFRNLSRVFNLLRNESILGNTQYFIVFDPQEQGYYIELNRKEGGRVKLDSPRILRPHSFPENFKLESISLTQKSSTPTRTQYKLLGTTPQQPVAIQVNSSGFVTPFTLFFRFDEEIWFIKTKDIMGHLEMKVLEDV